jgi:hypothetical protein
MRSIIILMVLAVTVGQVENAQSAEPGCRWWPWPWKTPHPPCPCCPDDYCRKKEPPCPPRVCTHAPDDYCPKALPCVVGVKCCGVDDYCCKPWRVCLPPCFPPWYTCNNPGTQCGPQSDGKGPNP